MNITINLSTANLEIVNYNIISKLYSLIFGNSQHNVTLSGNLYSATGYKLLIDTLVERFSPNLIITVPVEGQYLIFEDPLVENILKNIIGDGIGVTVAEAANANLVRVFERNTDITKFNEFRYFTSAKTNIPNLLFYLCSNLKEVYLEDTISIGDAAFRECGIEDVNAPSLLSIGINCFNLSGVKTITNLGSITTVPDYAFYRCKSLLSAVLPSTVTSIGAGAFNGSYIQVVLNFTTISGLDNVTSFGNSCFSSRSSLVIQGSSILNALTIGSNAFEGTAITGAISLPNLISLGNGAFKGCTNITSVDLTGSAITAIGASTFRGCSNLTKLVLPTTVTTVGNEWVVDIPRLITVEGTDNIANYGTANHEFRNPIIGNPVKTGIANNLDSLFRVQGNSANSGMSLHSLYEPLRKSTPVGTFIPGNQVKMTLFWNSSSNSANANIGLYYLKDIETFGYMTFYGTIIDNLIINNVTPPTLTTTEDSTLMGYTMYQDWGNVIFGPNSVIGTLWVPDSAVATYQANPLYSGLTIKGINTKTNGVDYDLPRYATYADWKTAEAAAVAQGGHTPQGLIEAWM